MDGSRKRLAGVFLALLALLQAARGQALGLDRRAKEETTKRFLKQLADLSLWAGTVACSDGAEDAVYTVRPGLQGPHGRRWDWQQGIARGQRAGASQGCRRAGARAAAPAGWTAPARAR